MKILLINNNTQHLEDLNNALAMHEVEIRKYQPGLDFSCADKDLIILSGGGGEGLEIHDEHKPGHLWYENQMNFIKTCQKPIIGICMGFEVISRAFGSNVSRMPQGVEDFIELETTQSGTKIFGQPKLKQFEAHDWRVQQAPSEFEVLAQSKTGIELIKHKYRPIIASQFHPEKGGTLSLMDLLAA